MISHDPPRWYHVTPIFSLPVIFESGGVKCGADVEADGLPRRSSSRNEDDRRIKALDDRRPSDCILLFKKPNPTLLKDKLSRAQRRGIWKASPHVVLSVCAAACLKAANYTVFGSSANIGQPSRGRPVEIRKFRSYLDVQTSKAEELLLPADCLEGRTLPLSAVRTVKCFSLADKELVQHHIEWSGHKIEVELEDQPRYVEGQSQSPGSDFLDLTNRLYHAIWHGEEAQARPLLDALAQRCFD
jgi:hypothetical protein